MLLRCTILAKDTLQGRRRTAVAAFDGDIVPFCFLYCAICHDVGNGAGEKDDEVCLTDLPFEIAGKLGENLAFAVEFFTDIHILTNHSVMASYYNYTHMYFLS